MLMATIFRAAQAFVSVRRVEAVCIGYALTARMRSGHTTGFAACAAMATANSAADSSSMATADTAADSGSTATGPTTSDTTTTARSATTTASAGLCAERKA